ncbi:MAG TPA: GNAT family N-acetyltransferase [Anaerolineae bacterium]
MTTNIWQGRKVRLRAMEPSDWMVFQTNDLDTDVARLCYEIPFPRSTAGTMKWAEHMATTPPQDDCYRLVIENRNGEVVGNLNTFECNRRCGTFKYGLAVMRPHWRQGYASEAIQLVLRYYFGELRYQKVTVHVYDFNTASIQLHRRLGFQEEGRLRRMIYTGGQQHDEILFGLTAEEFAGQQ